MRAPRWYPRTPAVGGKQMIKLGNDDCNGSRLTTIAPCLPQKINVVSTGAMHTPIPVWVMSDRIAVPAACPLLIRSVRNRCTARE